MAPLWQQLQALRTPSDMREAEELDYHITQNVLRFLESVPKKLLATGDDKAISDPLEVLRPEVDTLPYLYTLNAQIDVVTHSWKNRVSPKTLEVGGALWQKIVAFVTNFDHVEIRYAGAQWRQLMQTFDYASRQGEANDPIMRTMAQAMLRLDPSAGTFTFSHLLFTHLCLRASSFNEARLILDQNIHSFPPKECPEGTLPCSSHHLSNGYITIRSGLTDTFSTSDVLKYHLLGAMVFIGLHDWARASFYLEIILSTPTNNTATALMLEAYKKWVLVGLLMHGKVPSTPKNSNAAALKTIRSSSKAYEAVAEAFKQSDNAKLRAEVSEGHQIWNEDGNVGLLRHVFAHHRKLSVIRMQDIYAAVPMSMLTSKLETSPENAEEYVASLVREGLLNARVEPSASAGQPKILVFLQDATSGPLAKSEQQSRLELLAQSKRIKALAAHVEEADRRLSLTVEYMDAVRRSKKSEHDRSSPEQEGMDIAPYHLSDEEDESVMADVG